MEQVLNYVKPELVVVIIVLYFLGAFFKSSQRVKDKDIPMILGFIGVAICGIWVLATCPIGTPQEVAMAVFTSLVQGILVAGTSVYFNQLSKQSKKDE